VIARSTRVNIEADSLNLSLLGPDAKPGTAEFDLFVKEVAREMTVKAGQKCTAIRRALVPAAIADAVTEALSARLAKVVTGNPRNESVRMGPLATAHQLADAERGVAELEAVTELAPELVNPHVDLGLAYSRTGRLADAAASLERALAVSATNPIAHEELGLVYRKLARFADARAHYEQALALYPEFHLASRNLAILCDLYQRDYGCALRHYEAYRALVPDDSQVAIWIDDIKSRTGQ